MSESSEPRVGYLVNAFPVVSESFLVNELRGVEAAGVQVAILALSWRQDSVRPAGFEQIRAEVIRPPKSRLFGWLTYAIAHAASLASRPRSYLDLAKTDVWRPLKRWFSAPRKSKSGVRLRKRLRLFVVSPWVAKQAREGRIGHLHAHYAKDPLEVAVRASWLSGLSYSFAAHAKDLYTTPASRLSRRLAKARFALTCHPHGDRTLRELARPQDRAKIHLIPHGLDRRIFRPSTQERRPGLIVAAGRLTPKKGFENLVAACSLFPPDLEFQCVILGDGRERQRLERRVKRLGLKRSIRLLGFVEQRDLAKWFQRANVVTLPARVLGSGNRDGVPNVLAEAMACGAPVVSTPVGSIGELIEHGANGLLVPPDDPQSLAEALVHILRSSTEGLAGGVVSAVSELDYRKAAKRVARLHRRQLGASPRSPRVEFRLPEIDTARMINLARRRVQRQPELRADVESSIARAVSPGLAANAWRSDLPRMAERRVWDEVFKARRADDLERFALSRGVRFDSTTRVLDIGAGRGGLSVALRARGVSTASLDLRWRNCQVTRLRGRRYGLDLPAINGRAESLPFRDSSFNVVCLLEVLEHVADPGGLMREAHRVCEPEGLCVVTVVNRWAHLDPHYHLWGINFLPRGLAEVLLERTGRSKKSWRDNQRLTDMHYFSFGSFQSFARTAGFEVHDPWRPHGLFARMGHRLGRKVSLGFNTVTLVLEPR